MQKVTIPKEIQEAMKPELQLYKNKGASEERYASVYGINDGNISALTTYFKGTEEPHDINLEDVQVGNAFLFNDEGAYLTDKMTIEENYSPSYIDNKLQDFINKLNLREAPHPAVEVANKNTEKAKQNQGNRIKNK